MSSSEATPGPIALVGSGEYLEVMADIEGSLLAGRASKYVQIATAAVPDGPETVAKWHRLGAEQAQRLGVEQVVATVSSVEEANSPEFANLVHGAGLIYLSGGQPTFLADTLRDTLLWRTIVQEWQSGSALAGCSAGAMAMATWVPTIRHPREGGTHGLGILPRLRVIPHYDAFASRMPSMVKNFLAGGDPTVRVIGVDEETAIVGGPDIWEVRGRASAWLLGGETREFAAGTSFDIAAL